MPKTILITNAYSSRNKGDAGIIAGMVNNLAEQDTFHNARFLISSTAGPEERDSFPGTVIDSFQSLKRKLSPDTSRQQLGFQHCLLSH